jgi:hypothetical protein
LAHECARGRGAGGGRGGRRGWGAAAARGCACMCGVWSVIVGWGRLGCGGGPPAFV